jgi:hypothetical protein
LKKSRENDCSKSCITEKRYEGNKNDTLENTNLATILTIIIELMNSETYLNIVYQENNPSVVFNAKQRIAKTTTIRMWSLIFEIHSNNHYYK